MGSAIKEDGVLTICVFLREFAIIDDLPGVQTLHWRRGLPLIIFFFLPDIHLSRLIDKFKMLSHWPYARKSVTECCNELKTSGCMHILFGSSRKQNKIEFLYLV